MKTSPDFFSNTDHYLMQRDVNQQIRPLDVSFKILDEGLGGADPTAPVFKKFKGKSTQTPEQFRNSEINSSINEISYELFHHLMCDPQTIISLSELNRGFYFMIRQSVRSFDFEKVVKICGSVLKVFCKDTNKIPTFDHFKLVQGVHVLAPQVKQYDFNHTLELKVVNSESTIEQLMKIVEETGREFCIDDDTSEEVQKLLKEPFGETLVGLYTCFPLINECYDPRNCVKLTLLECVSLAAGCEDSQMVSNWGCESDILTSTIINKKNILISGYSDGGFEVFYIKIEQDVDDYEYMVRWQL